METPSGAAWVKKITYDFFGDVFPVHCLGRCAVPPPTKPYCGKPLAFVIIPRTRGASSFSLSTCVPCSFCLPWHILMAQRPCRSSSPPRREVHMEQLQLFVSGALRHPALVNKDGACLPGSPWRRGPSPAAR